MQIYAALDDPNCEIYKVEANEVIVNDDDYCTVSYDITNLDTNVKIEALPFNYLHGDGEVVIGLSEDYEGHPLSMLWKTLYLCSLTLINNPLTCKWELFDTDTNAYDTQCSNAFLIADGTPADNQMDYCCYCGLKIEVVEPSADT